MSDCGDWIADNEETLMEEFVGIHDAEPELIYGGLERAIKYPGLYKEPWEAIGAWVRKNKAWAGIFEDFCMEAWQSQAEAGPEPDRE